jgi:hypothetical protein
MKGSKYDIAFKRKEIRMLKGESKSETDVSQKIGIHIKNIYIDLRNLQ